MPASADGSNASTTGRRVAPDTETPAENEHRFGKLAWAAKLETWLQLDNVANSGPPNSLFSSLFGEGTLRGYVNIGEYFTINGLLSLEQVRDQASGGAFVDEALYIQRLYGVINVTPDHAADRPSLHLFGGKTHPRFGMGWYAAPGLYGTDFTEDYELSDKIGFGVRINLKRYGEHRLTLETFHADNGFLNTNFLPGGPPVGDPSAKRAPFGFTVGGEAGDTNRFDNFAAALHSDNLFGIDKLTLEAGWAKQHATPTDVRDEYSRVLGLSWEGPLAPGYVLKPMAEFASLSGQAGLDLDTNYLTLGSELEIRELWVLAVNATWRDVREYDVSDYHTDLTTGATVTHKFGMLLANRMPWAEGFAFSTGYRFDRRSGAERHTVGFQLRYERSL